MRTNQSMCVHLCVCVCETETHRDREKDGHRHQSAPLDFGEHLLHFGRVPQTRSLGNLEDYQCGLDSEQKKGLVAVPARGRSDNAFGNT